MLRLAGPSDRLIDGAAGRAHAAAVPLRLGEPRPPRALWFLRPTRDGLPGNSGEGGEDQRAEHSRPSRQSFPWLSYRSFRHYK